jgi:glycosyltransferase involved in cell wall biosynthesis
LLTRGSTVSLITGSSTFAFQPGPSLKTSAVTQKSPSLLVLIPAYNEEERIEPVLREYADYFRKNYGGDFQLVVILNGCVDNTIGVVKRVAETNPEISWLEFQAPIGKGGALIEGLKLAPLTDYIGYVDADGATSPKAFHDLVKLRDQADCVIASRWLPGAVSAPAADGSAPVREPRVSPHRAS